MDKDSIFTGVNQHPGYYILRFHIPYLSKIYAGIN
jgi:hypothetical protein